MLSTGRGISRRRNAGLLSVIGFHIIAEYSEDDSPAHDEENQNSSSGYGEIVQKRAHEAILA